MNGEDNWGDVEIDQSKSGMSILRVFPPPPSFQNPPEVIMNQPNELDHNSPVTLASSPFIMNYVIVAQFILSRVRQFDVPLPPLSLT